MHVIYFSLRRSGHSTLIRLFTVFCLGTYLGIYNLTENSSVVAAILCKRCPNMEFFLVRIFPCSDCIRFEYQKIRTKQSSVFGDFSRSHKYFYICIGALRNVNSNERFFFLDLNFGIDIRIKRKIFEAGFLSNYLSLYSVHLYILTLTFL